MPVPLSIATIRYAIVRRAFQCFMTTLLCSLFALPSTVRAQGDDESARLIPLPSPGKGLSFGLHWDADIFRNLDGGIKRGSATDSVLSLGFGLDTGTLGWWPGGEFALGAQAITSTHPSEYAGDLQTLSNLDAPNARQISEFWYSQAFGDAALVRAGIMDINSFFDVNDTANLFMNSSLNFTPSITANVPTATYPDSAWGVMARIGAEKNGWLLGVFQGDPGHRSTAFRGGAMFVAERDWQSAASGTQLGIGAWYRRAPATSGLPESDWGAYANLEQPISDSRASAFVQIGTSPGEVNEVPGYFGAGIVFNDVSPTVENVGIGFARAWIRDLAAETSVEATATIPLFDGILALQPDLQYIFHPSGVHPNALVAGLRLHLTLY